MWVYFVGGELEFKVSVLIHIVNKTHPRPGEEEPRDDGDWAVVVIERITSVKGAYLPSTTLGLTTIAALQ